MNNHGMAVAVTGKAHGHARLIISDTEQACQLVDASIELVAATDVLLVRADNTPASSAASSSVWRKPK